MAVKKLTELDEIASLAGTDLIDVSQDQGDGSFVSKKVQVSNVESGLTITESQISDLQDYLKLDCSNDPLTGNLDAGNNDVSNVANLTVEEDFVNQDPDSLDMGYSNQHDNRGYNETYITDKEIYNSKILGSVIEEEGSVKTVDGSMYVYLNDTWNEIVIGFRFREDDDEGYELEHKPIGFNEWYEVASGNSDQIAMNGLPITQQYTTSMGALPVPLEIDGGTF